MERLRHFTVWWLLGIVLNELLLQSLPVLAWQNWTAEPTNLLRAPDPRRGHSMVIWRNQVVIFGGRADDTTAWHDPKTYEIEEVGGIWRFKDYTSKSVIQCSSADTEVCEKEKTVAVAKYYNDIWSYDVDYPCMTPTWRCLEPGAVKGGCRIVMGARICTHPSERYQHASAVFGDGMVVYGGYSQLCSDYCDDMWYYDFIKAEWTELSALGENSESGPGKRTRFSSVYTSNTMIIFGGYRLWHGFSTYNSEVNDWSDYTQYPIGGYLDDLWVFHFDNHSWTQRAKASFCNAEGPRSTWSTYVPTCSLIWPSSRAGHVAALEGNYMYIHGGYRTYFPYIHSNDPGAGRGVLTSNNASNKPYPTYPFYLNDLWRYSLLTGDWELITPVSPHQPAPRTDHTMVQAGGVLLLFGGYSYNYYYGDFWQFNTTTKYWIEQDRFPHALYPENCTDDLIARKAPHSGVYYPYLDPNPTIYDGRVYDAVRHYGTGKFSVVADPTRLIGEPGRVLFPQARRQAPGWDGCRDRADKRQDLLQDLQYLRPAQRSLHTAVYIAAFDIVVVFGGIGYPRETLPAKNATYPAKSLSDLWEYNIHQCINNCSMKGDCQFGYCKCYDGYYGEDCSNSTCPGSFCYYDSDTRKQTCRHCCSAGYTHQDNDTYRFGINKLPCSLDNPGEENGICDGFGMCQCVPPFITADCSVKDCKHNCSGRGWCSVEYPVSRCMCDPGYIGEYCQARVCLNNCSYPNGVCLNGTCYCQMRSTPYNRTRQFYPWMGEDCSFLIPYARGTYLSPLGVWIFIFLGIVLLSQCAVEFLTGTRFTLAEMDH